jgi:excisionase family DNA binding protein
MKIQPPSPIEVPDSVVADGFLSVPEAAHFLHLSRAKVYQLMDAGQLQYARFGRARRVPKRALVGFAEASLVG